MLSPRDEAVARIYNAIGLASFSTQTDANSSQIHARLLKFACALLTCSRVSCCFASGARFLATFIFFSDLRKDLLAKKDDAVLDERHRLPKKGSGRRARVGLVDWW